MVKYFKDNFKVLIITLSIVGVLILTILMSNTLMSKDSFSTEIIYTDSIDTNWDITKTLVESFLLVEESKYILINKSEKRLYLYENLCEVKSFLVTIGKAPGNKEKPGDNRTPEGIFYVKSIDNCENWVYDYPGDQLEPQLGGYGPWFIRLEVPGFKGIGIHGTASEELMGKRASHGCIRINNEELRELMSFVRPGIPVIILPGEKDRQINMRAISIN